MANNLSAEDRQKIEEWRAFPRRRPDHIETPGPGQESVWDYPRPPRVEPVPERVRVEFGGQLVADSRRALRVLETAGPPVYYIPPEDVRTEFLEPSPHSTLCEWKGRARYWHLEVADHKGRNAAWAYPQPLEGYEAIRDYIAFYAQRVDAAYVGDEQVRPQPGQFYGGWITSGVVGPFKGEPGSEDW